MILSLTLGAANDNTVQASARAALASGTAILVLPVVLGRLADRIGVHAAYGVVALLLFGDFAVIRLAGRRTSQ